MNASSIFPKHFSPLDIFQSANRPQVETRSLHSDMSRHTRRLPISEYVRYVTTRTYLWILWDSTLLWELSTHCELDLKINSNLEFLEVVNE